jgi:cytidylate kinase
VSESTSPPASVICVSRSPGAGGELVGRIVSAELGFAYVDEEIVQRAAEKLEVPANLVADEEQRKPLLRRLLGEVAVDLADASMFTGVALPRPAETSDDYRDLIQEAIHETAGKGEVVIVAHAASIALAGRPEILRVLITGSPETRATRLVQELGVSAQEASALVREGDRARADYLKRFYGVKEELPTHYDVVVSTDVLAPEDAATLVLAARDGLAGRRPSGRESG